jgi:preprotein translocase subunit SecA
MTLDQQWKDHLLSMDHLKEGIGLRSMGGQDPKREYQKEGFAMFGEMHYRIRERAVHGIFHVMIEVPNEDEMEAKRAAEEARRRELARALQERHASSPSAGPEAQTASTVTREAPKVGRNAPCPCGSGRKYKQCHGTRA